MDKTPNPTSRLPLGVEKFPAHPCLWQRGGREGRGGENKTTDDGKKQIDNIYIKKKKGCVSNANTFLHSHAENP